MTIHTRTRFACPACGSDIGEAASLDSVRASMTRPTWILIFEMLARSPGKPVYREAVFDRLYGQDSDGGPEDANRTLTVHISQMRRMLEAYGWTISTSRGGSGNLAQWRLIPSEVSA